MSRSDELRRGSFCCSDPLSAGDTYVTHGHDGHDDDGHSAAPPDTDADPAMA